MYPHQVERLTAAREAAGVDAIVATAPANTFYVTGFRSLVQTVYPEVAVYGVFGPSGTALVLSAADAVTAAVDGAAVDHVRCHGRLTLGRSRRPEDDAARRVREWTAAPAATPGQALASALEAVGASRGRVGVDETGLTAAAWRHVVEHLGGHTVVEAARALARARRVKGPWEIECLQRALHAAEEAANEVIQALEPGMTEREAGAMFGRALSARAAEPHGVAILFGERSAFVAVAPSDRALRPGDLVRIDVGCVLKGYHAQLARTAVAGKPSDEQQVTYDAVQAALEAALEAVRPGATAGSVFEHAVSAARAAGLPDYDRGQLGHGIGLEAYERPKLAADSSEELEAGMVLRIEAPYFEPGWGGVHVRDTALVTRAGHAVMNRAARGLVALD